MIYRAVGYTLLAIAVLPLVSSTATCASTNTEAERAIVLDYARSKFQHLLSSRDPADPLADAIPDVFCKTVSRLAVPDVCGVPTQEVPVYLVDVLPITGAPIRDVIALSASDEAFSLLEPGGMTRMLKESQVHCYSEDGFLTLAETYLRLGYASRYVEMVPIVMCAVGYGYPASFDSCVAPEVQRTIDGFGVDIYVAPADRGAVSSREWSKWHFELSSQDSMFSAIVREDPSGR